ncbi:MAG: sterol desaturase family protein [Bacteroidota bacterium]
MKVDNTIFGIPNIDVYLVLGILLFFVLLEILAGHWTKSKRSFNDWIQEFGGWLALALIIKPLIVLMVLYVGSTFFPAAQYGLGGYPLWLTLPLYLFVDDFFQYWYHRSAHEYPFLWKLHRAHHQAEEMGFFVSYRNAALYYLMMPNIWWIAIFTFLGGAQAVALGLVAKQLIIISSHSTLAYDKILYRYAFLNPLASIWERIFITPAFHHAHHGQSKIDGISDPNNNFGNMFSIWDQLFGTAVFTRQFPSRYGLENDPKEHWTAAYLYPAVTAKNPESELSRNYQKIDTTRPEPVMIHLEKGTKYLWCQCGKSKQQPFCDGNHHGSKFKPLLFEAKRTGAVQLCNCKLTQNGPFCDDSHMDLS